MSVDADRVPGEGGTGTGARRALRTDALDNRNRIVEVAREAFAARGPDVTMREIARRAGVGVATLYRRFPTRESLVTEVFAEQVAACVAAVDDALADPDPWRGFCTVVEKACAIQTVDRGFTGAFLSAVPEGAGFAGELGRNARGFRELTRRAKDSGDLRADFAPGDLRLLLMANAGVVANSPAGAPALSRRLVALLLQSLRAHPSDPPEPLPPVGPPG
ncbi:TetR family transcriptional regulator [Streptomyces sulfonofaciens]|uniref:TetR family transcriptional regulator n=1 Tax=Streptomyces sulfonofaciens TaxID=68272 RepID=A0A919KZ25_9ACTN|nr:TetR/AcrR family transcriptional regulator [Streptomyces sulfonofaciens]GHH76946.1 TetR family transcriptional regulator [Streptomyces sulfonofaciens]